MNNPPPFSRRKFMKGLAASSLMPLMAANLLSCSSDNDDAQRADSISGQFLHGVASGDPLSDRVIIWTRVTPDREGDVMLQWEVALDSDFSTLLASGSGLTDAAVDYTAKVDVEGLDPNTRYYYRFIVGDTVSMAGATKTAPEGAVSKANFAVVSCSNYPAGLFSVYREVAKLDVDAVLHLGDYIYEYDAEGYATADAQSLGRVPEPSHEIVSLEDYRQRYAQYRGDADLQACHGAHAFIAVWDDHEVANDGWKNGAQNHQADSEGDFEVRKAAALQAYFEWIPIRPPADNREIIYRRFEYGDLIDLVMLDTRYIARDEALDYLDFSENGEIDVDAARDAFNDAERTLLGESQKSWLYDQLATSTARWQVLGQQVLMARYHFPAPIIAILGGGDGDENTVSKGTAAVLEALGAINKSPEERSEQEQALLDSAVPYNLDAWDGYNADREELMSRAMDSNAALVALAGDTHNAWASQLTTADGAIAGVEFGAPSVSSPGLDGVFGLETATLFEGLIDTLVPDLKYANLRSRGFLSLNFTADDVTAQWTFIDTVKSTIYSIDESQSHSMTVSREDLLLS